MSVSLLVASLVFGLASFVLPRSRVHPVLGTIAFATLFLSIFFLSEQNTRYAVAFVAILVAGLGYVFGVGILAASSTFPRRKERHTLLCGWAVPVTLVAIVWEYAGEVPNGRRDMLGLGLSVVVCLVAGFAIDAYQRHEARVTAELKPTGTKYGGGKKSRQAGKPAK